jgi:hypothetical protein
MKHSSCDNRLGGCLKPRKAEKTLFSLMKKPSGLSRLCHIDFDGLY